MMAAELLRSAVSARRHSPSRPIKSDAARTAEHKTPKGAVQKRCDFEAAINLGCPGDSGPSLST
ncbi:MAG: hypothetical protein CSA58_10035 [Micrococcales bacterium]|nr:MAG: hypothetical protein CSA58_10035 [Micrococcales bacterium]